MKFRKKPIVVEAVRWDESCRFAELPQWLSEAIGESGKLTGRTGSILRMGDVLHVFTLEGKMIAQPGDWIIRGVAGELYPCKPEIFAATYEPAE